MGILCRVLGRPAERNPNAEAQLLRAIALGDLAEVERITAGLDLSKVTSLSNEL